MFNEGYAKRMMRFYILIWILIAIMILIGFGVYKYFVKGETKMPFQISKIIIVSSANTTDAKLEDKTYSAEVLQNNDLYISLEKNPKYKKEEFIKEVSFDNFKVLDGEPFGMLEVYRPSKATKSFDYKEEYKQNSIKYIGTQQTNLKDDLLQVANQGGIINFSIVFNDLGRISYRENEDIFLNGKLLNKLEIPYSKIQEKVSFDVKITVESGTTFHTNIILNLPTNDISEEGISSIEFEGVKDLVFKRI